MTIAEPEVLVLMAVYNGEEWLSAQIDSILAQEAVSIRLVISIDRSSDSSRAISAKTRGLMSYLPIRATVVPQKTSFF